jgi:sugar O-acyltransferase (sialic acid O-acetyltransferase NeuD family)
LPRQIHVGQERVSVEIGDTSVDKDGQFIAWGSSGHAKVLSDALGLTGGRLVALFDNNFNTVSCLPSVPLFYGEQGFLKWVRDQDLLDGIGAFLAIGGARGEDRQNIAKLFRSVGLALPTLIHPSACVSRFAQLGIGTQVFAQAVVAADALVGDLCIINHGANVDHECVIGNGVHLAPSAVLCGCVTLEDNVMIGAGAVVLPRLKIGKGALIGAGAVVTRDVRDGVVVTGNPATFVREL